MSTACRRFFGLRCNGGELLRTGQRRVFKASKFGFRQFVSNCLQSKLYTSQQLQHPIVLSLSLSGEKPRFLRRRLFMNSFGHEFDTSRTPPSMAYVTHPGVESGIWISLPYLYLDCTYVRLEEWHPTDAYVTEQDVATDISDNGVVYKGQCLLPNICIHCLGSSSFCYPHVSPFQSVAISTAGCNHGQKA